MDSSHHDPGSDTSAPRPLLRRWDQVAVAVLLGLAWIAIAVGLWVRGYHRGRLIEIEQAEPVTITFRVDINHAEWTELTLLPDLGEALARRIVESREKDGPFRSPEDLRRVKGIGPKKLESIRPYLLPIPDTDAAGGQ
jgi:competence protein ComEA